MLTLKKTEHAYYCSDTNYHVGNSNGDNYGLSEYKNWKEFNAAWGVDTIDHDYNHCFRFDIVQRELRDEPETEVQTAPRYELHLFYTLQRKGNFVPVIAREITEDDLPAVNAYLEQCWEHLQRQWEEFSGGVVVDEDAKGYWADIQYYMREHGCSEAVAANAVDKIYEDYAKALNEKFKKSRGE